MKKTISNDKRLRSSKLRITTETVRVLTDRQLEIVAGGGSVVRTSQNTCRTATTD
ncbi:MAG: hypothetical protein JO257_10780 [Deltaproteobacteria bacterium]|nr:hypothetical protein [Deltaproteobacteria bacterium]